MADSQARPSANLGALCLPGNSGRVAAAPCAVEVDRKALAGCPPTQPPALLPRLLLPAPDDDSDGSSSTRLACVLSGCRDHTFPTISTPPRVRCFGVYDGAWIFLAIDSPRDQDRDLLRSILTFHGDHPDLGASEPSDQDLLRFHNILTGHGDHHHDLDVREPRRHLLLNARTGDLRKLPNRMMVLNPFPPYSGFLTIHSAALSSSPDDASCVAIFLSDAPHVRCVAIWYRPLEYAYEIRPPGDKQMALDAEDVVYYDGSFQLLLGHGDCISVCTPILSPESRWFCTEEWEHKYFYRSGFLGDQYVRDRYLVVSCGELLLVVRLTPDPSLPTSHFKLFRAARREEISEADAAADNDFPVSAYPCTWEELEALDGRVLFVGHGCSRSYEMGEYRCFRSGGVYFLDDDGFSYVEATEYSAPKVRSWVALPADCLTEVFDHIRCWVHRRRAYFVSKAWMKALKEQRPRELPPALPLLLLPDDSPSFFACVACRYGLHNLFDLLEARYFSSDRNDMTLLRGALCFGAYDGAWLFLHLPEQGRHHLYNFRTGDIRDLPKEISIEPPPKVPVKMIYRATALSSSPDDPGCIACSVVFISAPGRPRFRCVALWRIGWRRAREIRPPMCGPLHAEDVVYHEDGFHLLVDRGDRIRVYNPVLVGEEWEEQRFMPRRRRAQINDLDHYYAKTHYLVVSRGELLLVVRCRLHRHEPTNLFRVYLATKRPEIPETEYDEDDYNEFPVAAYPWSWSEMTTLEGRMLFVGHGCSRSFDTDPDGLALYDHFESGIYFVDDRKFYDSEAIFGQRMPARYPCVDNGLWSEDRLLRCFPAQEPSDYSPPAWFLP